MSKTIKLDDQVYERLEAIRGKGETFSQALERCLSVVEAWKIVWSDFSRATTSGEFKHGPERIRDLQVR